MNMNKLKPACWGLGLLAIGLAAPSPGGAAEGWKTFHYKCNAAVVGTQKRVLTGVHWFEGKGHNMTILEWCYAGTPPAYNLEVWRYWPSKPDMPPSVDGPYQV